MPPRVPKRRRTTPAIPQESPPTLALHPPGPPPTSLSLSAQRVAAYSPNHLAIWNLHSSPDLPAHLAATYVPPSLCAIRCAVLSPCAEVVALLIANDQGSVALLLLCANTGKRLLRVALPLGECQLVWTMNGEYDRGDYVQELPKHLQQLFKSKEQDCERRVWRPVKEECAKHEICVVDAEKLVCYQFVDGYQVVAKVASCSHGMGNVKLGCVYDVKRKEDCVQALISGNTVELYRGTVRVGRYEKLPFRTIAVCAVDGEKVFMVVERVVRKKGRTVCWAIGDGKWRYVHAVDNGARVVREGGMVWIVGNGVYAFEVEGGVRKREVGERVRRVLEKGGEVRGLGGCVDGGVAMVLPEVHKP